MDFSRAGTRRKLSDRSLVEISHCDRPADRGWFNALEALMPGNPTIRVKRTVRRLWPYAAVAVTSGIIGSKLRSDPSRMLVENVALNTRVLHELVSIARPEQLAKLGPREPVHKHIADRRLRQGHLTGPISVGTFNSFADKGNVKKGKTLTPKNQESLADFVLQTDIAGLQEVESNAAKMKVAEAVMDSRDIFFGNSSNPIIYDYKKFDLIHGETMVSHKENQIGSASDQNRTTNAVLLRQKTTDAVLLVTNRHQDHQLREIDDVSRGIHNIQTFRFVNNMNKRMGYQIDIFIDLGDFNVEATESEKSQLDVFSASGIDRIGAYSDACKVEEVGSINLGRDDNGDWYPHDRLIAVMQGCRATLRPPNPHRQTSQEGKGALIYPQEAFSGRGDLIGFGMTDRMVADEGKTFSVRSIRISPDTDLAVTYTLGGDQAVAVLNGNCSTLNSAHQNPHALAMQKVHFSMPAGFGFV